PPTQYLRTCLYIYTFNFHYRVAIHAYFRLQSEADTLYIHSNGSVNDVLQLSNFEDVALKYGTDKVTTHKYQFMYEKYLPSIRGLPVKMLEIGLGCNMDYGPGASYFTWLEYFPFVELYFIEIDSGCVIKYRENITRAHVFVGDQSNVGFLELVAANATASGLFDLIIDDGGHTMKQQITSLEHLWPKIKPGGFYFIEDLQTSYLPDYGGARSTKDTAIITTMNYIKELLCDMMLGQRNKPVSRDLLSVDCMAEICTLQKC
ncbi:hypothetical protein CP533_2511, partial [Ophiocordyceps camponoti-saundersi (nom. inval.)]